MSDPISTSQFYRRMAGPWHLLGFEEISNPTAATALTVPAGSEWALFSVATANMRFRDDGTDPTATVGIVVPSNTVYEYKADALSAVKVIGTGSVVTVSYYK